MTTTTPMAVAAALDADDYYSDSNLAEQLEWVAAAQEQQQLEQQQQQPQRQQQQQQHLGKTTTTPTLLTRRANTPARPVERPPALCRSNKPRVSTWLSSGGRPSIG